MDQHRHIDIEDCGGGVRLLRLNRPEVRNALSIALRDELSQSVDVIAGGDDVGG